MELTFLELEILAEMNKFMYTVLGANKSMKKFEILKSLKNSNGTSQRAIEKFIELRILMPDKNDTWFLDSDTQKIIIDKSENMKIVRKIYENI